MFCPALYINCAPPHFLGGEKAADIVLTQLPLDQSSLVEPHCDPPLTEHYMVYYCHTVL